MIRMLNFLREIFLNNINNIIRIKLVLFILCVLESNAAILLSFRDSHNQVIVYPYFFNHLP